MNRITSTQFVIGLVIIAVGVLFLLDSVNVIDTGDVFQWIPSLFILLGLWLLLKNRFPPRRRPADNDSHSHLRSATGSRRARG